LMKGMVMTMRRKKRRHRKLVFLFISLCILFVLSAFAYIQMKPKVAKAVTIEAGSLEVNIQEFILDKGSNASFLTNINTLDLSIPGAYEVQIDMDGKVYTSQLIIEDTVPPKAESVNYIALVGEKVPADALITNITDATDVEVSFKEPPDTSILGEQEVTVLLKDAGGNKTEMNAMITVLDINHSITVEAGSIREIRPEDFITDKKYSVSFVTDPMSLDLNIVGTHIIQFNINGIVKNAGIEVVDTIPPIAVGKVTETWLGETIDPITFLTDIQDATEVKASYKQAPNFSVLGEQNVTILLKDEGCNTSEIEATLIVKEDLEAPEILGVRDKTVYIGDTVSHRKGVSVIDNKDKDVSLQIDSSKVNLKKEGTYPVTYTAIDSSGNTATKTSEITVKALLVAEDTLNELVDDVLSQITDQGMTQKEIAKKIYTWTKGHIAYTGDSDKSDWMAEAYRGIKNGVGDCFTYFCVSQAMLNRAGIDNIGLTRVGGRTRHYWSLINCGEGWYHFDSTPHKDHRNSFYLTQSEVNDLTDLRGNNYYIYDETTIDVIPE